jgi:hypothetical protein
MLLLVAVIAAGAPCRSPGGDLRSALRGDRRSSGSDHQLGHHVHQTMFWGPGRGGAGNYSYKATMTGSGNTYGSFFIPGTVEPTSRARSAST